MNAAPTQLARCVCLTLATERLAGLLAGLKIEGGKLIIEANMFPCCAGSAHCSEASSNTVVICSLKRRFARVKKLFDQYYQIWGLHHPLLPQELNNNQMLAGQWQTLQNFFAQHASRDLLKLSRCTSHIKPSDLWPMALTTAWRHDRPIHFVEFDRQAHLPMAPMGREHEKKIIFVGNVYKLSDPSRAFALEEIIAYAYHSQSFLFLEFAMDGGVASRTKSVGRNYFAARLAALQSRSPLLYLQKDAYSRLQAMCSDLKL